MPAMRPNWRSRGVATADAMVCGSAPGSDEPTCITGYSTCGRGATGRKLKASAPDRNNANVSNEVPTGRLMNGAEMFIVNPQPPELPPDSLHDTWRISAPAGQTIGKPPASYIR